MNEWIKKNPGLLALASLMTQIGIGWIFNVFSHPVYTRLVLYTIPILIIGIAIKYSKKNEINLKRRLFQYCAIISSSIGLVFLIGYDYVKLKKTQVPCELKPTAVILTKFSKVHDESFEKSIQEYLEYSLLDTISVCYTSYGMAKENSEEIKNNLNFQNGIIAYGDMNPSQGLFSCHIDIKLSLRCSLTKSNEISIYLRNPRGFSFELLGQTSNYIGKLIYAVILYYNCHFSLAREQFNELEEIPFSENNQNQNQAIKLYLANINSLEGKHSSAQVLYSELVNSATGDIREQALYNYGLTALVSKQTELAFKCFSSLNTPLTNQDSVFINKYARNKGISIKKKDSITKEKKLVSTISKSNSRNVVAPSLFEEPKQKIENEKLSELKPLIKKLIPLSEEVMWWKSISSSSIKEVQHYWYQKQNLSAGIAILHNQNDNNDGYNLESIVTYPFKLWHRRQYIINVRKSQHVSECMPFSNKHALKVIFHLSSMGLETTTTSITDLKHARLQLFGNSSLTPSNFFSSDQDSLMYNISKLINDSIAHEVHACFVPTHCYTVNKIKLQGVSLKDIVDKDISPTIRRIPIKGYFIEPDFDIMYSYSEFRTPVDLNTKDKFTVENWRPIAMYRNDSLFPLPKRYELKYAYIEIIFDNALNYMWGQHLNFD